MYFKMQNWYDWYMTNVCVVVIHDYDNFAYSFRLEIMHILFFDR